MTNQMIRDNIYEYLIRADMSSWRNRLARSTVNREVVGSIPTEDAFFFNGQSNNEFRGDAEKVEHVQTGANVILDLSKHHN